MGFLTDFLLWQGSAFRFFISRISTSDLPAVECSTVRDRQPGTGQHKKQTGGGFTSLNGKIVSEPYGAHPQPAMFRLHFSHSPQTVHLMCSLPPALDSDTLSLSSMSMEKCFRTYSFSTTTGSGTSSVRQALRRVSNGS